MHLSRLLKVGLRNARYYRRYSWAAVLAIGVSFTALALFRLYMVDATFLMSNVWKHRFMLGDVIVDEPADGAQRAITPAAQAFLEAWLAKSPFPVKAHAAFLEGNGIIYGGGGGAVFVGRGYDPAAGAQLRGEAWAWDALAGKPLQLAGADGAVIGRQLAETLGCRIDPVDDQLDLFGYPARERPFTCPSALWLQGMNTNGQMNVQDVQVAGVIDAVFREIDTRLVLLPLPTMQKLLATDTVSYYSIELRRQADVPAFVAALREGVRADHLALTVTPWEEHRLGDLFMRSMEALTIYDAFLSVIMSSLAALVVFTVALKLIDERTQEIGTLRAIGIGSPAILGAGMIEGLATALIGVALGAAVTLVATLVINRLRIPYQLGGLTQDVPFRIGLDPWTYLRTGLALSLISVGTTGICLWRKMRRTVVDNLAFR